MDRPQGLLDLDFRLRRAALMLLYLVILIVILGVIRYAQSAIGTMLAILSPFIVALIIAYIFNPIVNWLQRKFHLGRIGGVLITYAFILSITVGFFSILVPILYGQLREGITSIVNNFPVMLERATHWLQLKVSPEEMQQAKQFIQDHADLSMLQGQADQVTQGTRIITKLIGTTISVTIGFIAFVSFVVVICFYFLLDFRRLEHITRVLLPEDTESKVFNIWAKIDTALGGYLRGQVIVATTIGVLYTVGLMFMGMKEYAILVGFLAGFGNMIPYTGPVLGGVPAGLWVIFGDTYDTGEEKLICIGIIVLFSIAIQTLDGLFLQPRIVGKNAELHPLMVLLALFIGAQFGIGGMIIAVPAAIMLRVVIKELWWDPMEQQEFENKKLAALKYSNGQAIMVQPMVSETPPLVKNAMNFEAAERLDASKPDLDNDVENAVKKPRRRRRRKPAS